MQDLHAQELQAGQSKQADNEQAEAEVQRLQSQLERQARQTEQVCIPLPFCVWLPCQRALAGQRGFPRRHLSDCSSIASCVT